jgi:hypothetical protein
VVGVLERVEEPKADTTIDDAVHEE